MEWNEVVIVTSTEAVDAVANLFMDAGAKGTAIEDELDFINLKDDGFGQIKEYREQPEKNHHVYVKAYFPNTEAFTDTLKVVQDGIERLSRIELFPNHFELKINDLKEEDWENSWKEFYRPLRVTRYLTIVPHWEEYSPTEDDEKILRMDPGMAFGTGTHPTTKLALQALETTIRGNEKIMDVGTGSGVLSIAAKALGVKEVLAFDIDHVATRQSKENIQLNPYALDVVIKENNLLEGLKDSNADIIVANILAEILLKMTKDAWQNLKDGGTFILSGIIQSKRDELLKQLLEDDFILEQELIMDDWHCFICKKEVESNECNAI